MINLIFSFTQVFINYFKKKLDLDYFPCEFLNHIFLPHLDNVDKSLDNFSNIIYPDYFLDKIKNRSNFLFLLTLISKSMYKYFLIFEIFLNFFLL